MTPHCNKSITKSEIERKPNLNNIEENRMNFRQVKESQRNYSNGI